MNPVSHNLPVTIDQVIAWVRQCTVEEKKRLMSELITEKNNLLLASEKSLAKDWLSKEDEAAWKDL
jgi:hypothetical protein